MNSTYEYYEYLDITNPYTNRRCLVLIVWAPKLCVIDIGDVICYVTVDSRMYFSEKCTLDDTSTGNDDAAHARVNDT